MFPSPLLLLLPSTDVENKASKEGTFVKRGKSILVVAARCGGLLNKRRNPKGPTKTTTPLYGLASKGQEDAVLFHLRILAARLRVSCGAALSSFLLKRGLKKKKRKKRSWAD